MSPTRPTTARYQWLSLLARLPRLTWRWMRPTVSESAPAAEAHFTLNATVRNQGNGASVSTTLRYYQSTDSTITTDDTVVGTDSVSGLNTSGVSAVSISLTAPATPGTYHYGACVDSVSNESDTTNNCSLSVAVTVGAAPSPDLAVNAPTVSESAPAAEARFHSERHGTQPGQRSVRFRHAALLPVHRLDDHNRRHSGGHGLCVQLRRLGERSRVDQSDRAGYTGDVPLRRLRRLRIQ